MSRRTIPKLKLPKAKAFKYTKLPRLRQFKIPDKALKMPNFKFKEYKIKPYKLTLPQVRSTKTGLSATERIAEKLTSLRRFRTSKIRQRL